MFLRKYIDCFGRCHASCRSLVRTSRLSVSLDLELTSFLFLKKRDAKLGLLNGKLRLSPLLSIFFGVRSETFSLTERGKCGYVERRLLRHDGVRFTGLISMDGVGCAT